MKTSTKKTFINLIISAAAVWLSGTALAINSATSSGLTISAPDVTVSVSGPGPVMVDIPVSFMDGRNPPWFLGSLQLDLQYTSLAEGAFGAPSIANWNTPSNGNTTTSIFSGLASDSNGIGSPAGSPPGYTFTSDFFSAPPILDINGGYHINLLFPVTGTLPNGSFTVGYSLNMFADGDSGAFVDAPLNGTITFESVSAIPEPSEMAMMVAGLCVVSLIARKRKNR
jgi:hypothetical protein